MAEAAKTMKTFLELGGKSASIIFEDADLNKAIPLLLPVYLPMPDNSVPQLLVC